MVWEFPRFAGEDVVLDQSGGWERPESGEMDDSGSVGRTFLDWPAMEDTVVPSRMLAGLMIGGFGRCSCLARGQHFVPQIRQPFQGGWVFGGPLHRSGDLGRKAVPASLKR